MVAEQDEQPWDNMTEEERRYHHICRALLDEADKDKAKWREVVRMTVPELLPPSDLLEVEHKDTDRRRICGRARNNCFKLAGAFQTYIHPMGRKWFKFGSYTVDSSDKEMATEDEYQRAGDILFAEIERSNFHTVVYSAELDAICTGTGAFFVGMHPKGRLFLFTHIPAGTFGFGENAEHEPDKFVRRFKYTADQAAQAWGEDSLTDAMRNAYASDTRRYTDQFEIHHLTLPNPAGNGYAYIGVYMDANTGETLYREGYEQFPYVVRRFRKYGNQTFGNSPLKGIEDTIKDNLVDKECRKLMHQRATMPSIIAPADMAGEIDLRPGGKTIIYDEYIDRPNAIREFAPVGNWMIGLDGERKDEEEMDAALHIDFLQVVSSQERYMSATEVNQRVSEKVMTLAESFTLAQVEYRPMFNRLLALALESGMLDENNLPREMVANYKDSNGVKRQEVVLPRIVYCGMMAQMLERVQSTAIWDMLARAKQMGIELQDPRWTVSFDPVSIVRFEAANSGVPARYMLDYTEVQEQLQQTEAAQAAQQQAMVDAQNAESMRAQAQAQNLTQQ